MGNKLYVGNLPYTATEQEIATAFAQSGTVVSAKIIMDRESGRSKGFGFVEMSTDQEAQNAIESFNGAEMGGRALTVNEAKPMAPRAPRQDFSGNPGAGPGSSDRRDNRRDRRERW